MCTTLKDQVNADLLAFIKAKASERGGRQTKTRPGCVAIKYRQRVVQLKYPKEENNEFYG
jgi:hypothetical protein